MTIKEIIAAIIAKEGGYVNHKADKGGPTKHGITANAYAEYFRKQAKDITIAEIKSVPPALAEKIYYTLYFVRPNIINLPSLIQPIVLDMAVNHGRRGAVKILQTALVSSGYSHAKPDGLIGKETIKAASLAVEWLGSYFINIIVDCRLNYYRDIIKKDPTQEVFKDGWFARAESFRQQGARA